LHSAPVSARISPQGLVATQQVASVPQRELAPPVAWMPQHEQVPPAASMSQTERVPPAASMSQTERVVRPTALAPRPVSTP
jgi:hypothetical protein